MRQPVIFSRYRMECPSSRSLHTFIITQEVGNIKLMKMSNGTYDKLKWIAQYFLPAAGVFYAAISKIWGLPYGTEIVGTIAAVDTFMGAVLGISTSQYNKGLKE